MIQHSKINEINDKTDEGKLLIIALATLTSLSKKDIDNGKWGEKTNPDKALQQLTNIANKIFFTEEYKRYKLSIKRNNKINNILKLK
jgi:predicted metalloendopeptidase